MKTGIMGALSNIIAPIIFALALAAFVWGVVNYFFIHGGEEGKRAEGRQFMLWGVIGLTVLFTFWGLVVLLLSTLGLSPAR